MKTHRQEDDRSTNLTSQYPSTGLINADNGTIQENTRSLKREGDLPDGKAMTQYDEVLRVCTDALAFARARNGT